MLSPHAHTSLAHLLELADAEACADYTRAAPSDVADQYGIRVRSIGNAVATMASGINVLAFNRVVGVGMATPATGADLDAIIAGYRDAGVRRFFVQVSPAAHPLALLDALRKRGFTHHNSWMKLYRRAEPYPKEPEGALRIRPVDAATAGSFGSIVAGAFGMPEVAARWMTGTVGRPGWHQYLAYDGETPVSGGAMYVMGDVAWLGMAGTVAGARRRGAQSALIRHRVNAAYASGCQWVVVETAADTPERPAPSFQNLRRLGFVVAYPRPNYLFG